jgi:hypothetical protein
MRLAGPLVHDCSSCLILDFVSSARGAPRFAGELIASGYEDGGYPLRGRSNWLQIGSVRCAPATVALAATKPTETELFAGADSTRHRVREWFHQAQGARMARGDAWPP